MEARGAGSRWTYAEFARLPDSGSTRHEVIGGTLVVTPAPGRRHQRILTDLATLLNEFVARHALGEVFAGPFDVLLDEGEYLEPDLLFVATEHLRIVTDRGVEGPPDLVVEIASPSTAQRDRGIKLDTYRRHGVAEYWILDPEQRTLELWYLGRGATAPVVYLGGHLRWGWGDPAATHRTGGRVEVVCDAVLSIDLDPLFDVA